MREQGLGNREQTNPCSLFPVDKFFAGGAVALFNHAGEFADEFPFVVVSSQLPLLATFRRPGTPRAFSFTAPHFSRTAIKAAIDTIKPTCSNIVISVVNMLTSRPKAGATDARAARPCYDALYSNNNAVIKLMIAVTSRSCFSSHSRPLPIAFPILFNIFTASFQVNNTTIKDSCRPFFQRSPDDSQIKKARGGLKVIDERRGIFGRLVYRRT